MTDLPDLPGLGSIAQSVAISNRAADLPRGSLDATMSLPTRKKKLSYICLENDASDIGGSNDGNLERNVS